MNIEIVKKLSIELNISQKQVNTVLTLLSEGCTIPFIARYRKEATGYLDENIIKEIENIYSYNLKLEERKEAITKLIDEQGLLTPEIKKEIASSVKLSELEEIYEPFKLGKKTKKTEAIKKGLEGLAKAIMLFEGDESIADPYINDEIKTRDEAFLWAGYIIAEDIASNIKYKNWIKENTVAYGNVKTKKKTKAIDDKKIYEMYYDYKEKVNKILPHRVLAISRAEKDKIISYDIEVNSDNHINYLISKVIGDKLFPLRDYVLSYINDSYKRLIFPSVERSIKTDLFDKASETGVNEFGNNLKNLLLTPPLKEKIVLGFDPAFRTGCKLAVLDKTGKCLKIDVIYPHEPFNKTEESTSKLLELINEYKVEVISIGNGTASRESEMFVSKVINDNKLNVKYVITNEAGASVYSASKEAQEEFPSFSASERSAISIGRRLQDTLSEIVKIDPKSIGVGLYQHDLKKKELDDKLSFVVENIVNEVGVNLNNASKSLLSYVSGLKTKTINAIKTYIEKKGSIKSREELSKIKGIDEKTFEQCAGFLRILNGDNPLDKTNIHPEKYEVVEKMLKDNNISKDLIGSDAIKPLLEHVNNTYGLSSDEFEMIKTNLYEGIIDPRENATQVALKSGVLTLDDVKIGDEFEGTVRNVTTFGAFVDIGLHDDALIHISKISKNFIKHPSEVLKVGDKVNATVIDINKEKERVSLSLI